MAKVIHVATPLDGQVADLLRRVGALESPLDHVTGYNVERSMDFPHIVTVRLIADEQFDAPAPCGNAEGVGGWDPQSCIRPAGHADDEHYDGRVYWRSPEPAAQAEECSPAPPSA